MRTSPDEGFTLVELLVTMVIIGVITAIAIPVFLTQREKAYHTAMKADLKAIVLSEASWSMGSQTYTDDLALLSQEGYKASPDVTAHVALLGTGYVACTRHHSASTWLVFDSTTSVTTTSSADCA